MESLRKWCTGPRPVHSFQPKGGISAALIAGAAVALTPAPAAAQPTAAASVAAVARSQNGQSVDDFYKARKGEPLWLTPQAGDAADQLLALLGSASIDGLSPARYRVDELQAEIETARAKHKRKLIQRADEALSEAYVAYVDDLRRDPGVGIS